MSFKSFCIEKKKEYMFVMASQKVKSNGLNFGGGNSWISLGMTYKLNKL